MKLESKYFDKIRTKSAKEAAKPVTAAPCDWPGCEKPGPHRAPKGRNMEGQYFNYCSGHAQLYNKNYNYFAGMAPEAIAGWQKDSMTGHRPTWRLGQNASTIPGTNTAEKAETLNDPFSLLGAKTRRKTATPAADIRKLKTAELKALHILGLDESATAVQVKAKYKVLVKRLHPDANGGSRANEDTLKAVIQAYDSLKSSGFC